VTVAADVDPDRIGGLAGWVAGVIDSLGETGVGLLVALETVLPPVPSEVVLAVSGFLAGEGRLNVVLVTLAATAGSVVGALALYWLGAAVGEDRLKRRLDRLPLIEVDDLENADRWFERHGRWAVFIGRMVPVVRSLVSIPAGANRMPLGEFLTLTALGSGLWNSLLIGLGFTLGERWQQVEQYSTWFDLVILLVFVATITSWAVRRIRRRRQHAGS